MSQKHNKRFYEEAISKYGISAQGVHWNSQESQYKRFEILTQFIKEDIPTSLIIDVGCGMGEYYNYLMDNNLKPESYLGIDCEQQMIDIAQKRYPRTNFKLQNVLTDRLLSSDYYICSGALNILDVEDVYVFIKKCFEKSTKGFVFNFLKKESYTNITPKQIITLCEMLTSQIETKDNYLENDFSIFLKK